MTDLEYRLIKETIKKEVLQEMSMQPKTESLETITKKSQQAIFDKYFLELRKLDAGRYWRIKEAVIKLTNLCRFRTRKVGAWNSIIQSETEAESAISTYEAIYVTTLKLIGELGNQEM